MNDVYQLTLGVTSEFDCSYLPQRREKLLMVHPKEQNCSEAYEQLMDKGFRRGGEDAYRPHCDSCNACQSIRLDVGEVSISKSQKRILSKNRDITLVVTQQPKPHYFELYSRYITHRHANGSMFPPKLETLETFTQCSWLDRYYIEGYLDDQLVSVAVCDSVNNALSAVYTFFEPTLDKRSLGQYNILQQLSLAKTQNKRYLYLGYQIDECSTMNYKKNYRPNERFIEEQWIKFKK